MRNNEPEEASASGQRGDAGGHEVSQTSPSRQGGLRIGDVLVREGTITAAQLEEGLARQRERGGFLGQALVELGYVTHDKLVGFLVQQCKIPHINLLDYRIMPEILGLIPHETCFKYGVLPIDKLGRIVTVAMVDPLDIEALEQVRKACPDLKIKPILCDWSHLEQVMRRLRPAVKDNLEEVSMTSFGLSERPKPAVAAGEGPPGESAHATPGQDSAGAVREKVHQAMQLAAAAIAAQLRAAQTGKTSPPSIEEMATMMRAAIRDAMVASMASRPLENGSSTFSAEELVEPLRDSVRDALATLLMAGRQGAPPPQELARMIQESMRRAVRDAIPALAQEAQQPSRPPAEGRKVEQERDTRRVIAALQRGQAQQEVRIAQLLEAVTKATQAAERAASRAEEEARRAADEVESLAVAEHTRRELTPAQGPSWGLRRLSAAEKAARDALEARDGPGLRLRVDERLLAALESERPLAGFTFETFFVGPANDFTFKLGKSVAQNPGRDFNPFFLYGDVGVGKTHLINAIGNEVQQRNAEKVAGYVSSSRFAQRIIEALEDHALDALREAYCGWDMLILDDIQFLAGRIEAQEELFHIFNALHQAGRQIIIAGDKPPDRLGQLEKRLVSRFSSGIVAYLKSPERETRMEILRHHAATSGVNVSEEILALIAGRETTDIRRMTGALRKVVAFAGIVGQEITVDLVNEILSHLEAQQAE